MKQKNRRNNNNFAVRCALANQPNTQKKIYITHNANWHRRHNSGNSRFIRAAAQKIRSSFAVNLSLNFPAKKILHWWSRYRSAFPDASSVIPRASSSRHSIVSWKQTRNGTESTALMSVKKEESSNICPRWTWFVRLLVACARNLHDSCVIGSRHFCFAGLENYPDAYG